MVFFGNNSQKKRMQRLRAAANEARDKSDWTAAARHYKDYLDIRSDDAAIWVQYGHALKESQDLEGAEKAYQQSLSLAPEVADTHLMLGHLKKMSGDLARAAQHYADAVGRAPDELDARIQLAFAEKDLGHFDRALSHFSEARKLDPENTEITQMIRFLSDKGEVGGQKDAPASSALSREVESLKSTVRALSFELQKIRSRDDDNAAFYNELKTEIKALRDEARRRDHDVSERMLLLETQTPEIGGRFRTLIDHIDATAAAVKD